MEDVFAGNSINDELSRNGRMVVCELINNYCTRLSKISSSISSEQVNSLPKPKFCENQIHNIVVSFDPQVFFSYSNFSLAGHISHKSVVPITHEQNTIYSNYI